MQIKIHDNSIKLGQAMKLAGLVDEGADAKAAIQNGEVTVNGETEVRRGRKLICGDSFTWNETTVTIATDTEKDSAPTCGEKE